MTNVPLPQPEELEVLHRNSTVVTVQGYSAKSMHAHAAAVSAEENKALRAEAESFQMAYRMKCDIETKALEERVRVLEAQLASCMELRRAICLMPSGAGCSASASVTSEARYDQ
jgi:hypothetical protein